MIIYKYEVGFGSYVEMPIGAKILHFNRQREKYFIWALVDPDAKTETRKFMVFGTGHVVVGETYIGTLIDGDFVWHLFEVTEWLSMKLLPT